MKKEQQLAILKHFESELPNCKRNVVAINNMIDMAENILDNVSSEDSEIIHLGERVIHQLEELLDKHSSKR